MAYRHGNGERRYGWPVLGALAALLLLPGLALADAPPAQNLLIITLDTTRADRLSAYGSDHASVPGMDRLFQEGARFDSAYTVSPVTLASHVSLFTGLYPRAHGVRNNATFRLGSDAVTLAERLRDAGFQTGAVVGSQVLHANHGLDQGFDEYDDSIRGQEGSLFTQRNAEAVVDRGLEWLGERDKNSRWFLWLHLFDPHAEYEPPEPYRRQYAESPYDGEIAYADEQIRRMFSYLEQQGVMDRTLIVVTSDHGESLGDHGEPTHGIFVYDATARIPLLMRYPGRIPSGRAIEDIVRIIDVAPTALEILGVEPGNLSPQGSSLIPLVEGRKSPPRTAFIVSWAPRLLYGWSELTAIRAEGWKYIRAPRPELYALVDDPEETQDLAQ
jgi:arylsulfatase A-like enzyme